MTSITLAESAKLSQDELIAGVIESLITVNKMYEQLPFRDIEGNSLAYDRENVLGDVQALAVGGTITAKAAATVTQVTSSLTTLVGDAEVNQMIQATRSNINDQTGVQIASKAKSIGRKYQNMMINGDGISPNFPGLLSLADATRIMTPSTDGDAFSLTLLDDLMSMVKDKDGTVDWIAMTSRTLSAYRATLRALGGAAIMETTSLPSGAKVPVYRDTPIFVNDWIPINQVQGSCTTATSILAGTFDDGSGKYGISGLTARNAAGIIVEDVGLMEQKDERITRIKWYCSLALFNLNGLAVCPGITN